MSDPIQSEQIMLRVLYFFRDREIEASHEDITALHDLLTAENSMGFEDGVAYEKRMNETSWEFGGNLK